jgi:HlyD family secretion protein
VSFKVQGRIVDLPVEEGQQVEQGALLARLEDADYKQRVRIDEAGVRVRESNLALTLAGTREQEVKAAQQTMIDAQADLEQKKLDTSAPSSLFAKDEVSAQERDLAATALKRAEAVFKEAQQRYNEAVEGSRKEEIAIARANLNQASANLGLSRVNLDYTILRAPSAGVITVRQAELGEVVAPGSPVVTLADLDHIWLRAYIAETDLGRIHWGQEATVTTDTYPGKQYHGRISFISSNAEFTPKSVQTYKERVTLVYRIKIDIDNPNHELKPGMPADAHIDLAAAGPEARRQRNDGPAPIRDCGRGAHQELSRRARRRCLSFDVRAGEIFGLVGPDGAGKTTTLRMLAGIMPPDAGKATVAGFDVVRDPEGAKHAPQLYAAALRTL